MLLEGQTAQMVVEYLYLKMTYNIMLVVVHQMFNGGSGTATRQKWYDGAFNY